MADNDAHYTRLSSATGTFNEMMQGFSVVTVMNAEIYAFDGATVNQQRPETILKTLEADRKANTHKLYKCTLDTLKIANVTVEGPSKTISGGRYANPLIKFGKTARLEMQDALGSIQAIDLLCGGIAEQTGKSVPGGTAPGDYIGLHIGEDFNGPITIIGDTFFISKKDQQQVKVKIIFYQFMPDSIFNLTQDAEGDAAVFDMNGDLLITDIKIGSKDGSDGSSTKKDIVHGLFYSIVDPNHPAVSGA